MSRSWLASLVFGLFLCSSTGLSAGQEASTDRETLDWSHRTIVGVHGGAQFPRGYFEDYYHWGYGGGASVGREIRSNTIVSLAAAFHHFSEYGVGHVGSVVPVTVNADYMIPTGDRKLIVGVGAGLYHVAESGSGYLGYPETQNTFGMNARIGIVAPVSRTVAVTPTLRFHYANPSRLVSKVTFVALQLDANFGL